MNRGISVREIEETKMINFKDFSKNELSVFKYFLFEESCMIAEIKSNEQIDQNIGSMSNWSEREKRLFSRQFPLLPTKIP